MAGEGRLAVSLKMCSASTSFCENCTDPVVNDTTEPPPFDCAECTLKSVAICSFASLASFEGSSPA